MALSDDLTKLAVRTKEAETRAEAARDQARADLEEDVSSARESAQEEAAQLRQDVEAGEERVSGWFADVQRSWDELVAKVRKDVEGKRAEHDVHKANKRAEHAEEYASSTIAFAYSAVVEAEYAVLDATLARMDADQVSHT